MDSETPNLTDWQIATINEVHQALTASAAERAHLRSCGWERIVNPALVNLEFVWEHPTWGVRTQSHALRFTPLDNKINKSE